MRKFLAVVKHEYKKVVFKWSFLLATFLFPLMIGVFSLIPLLVFSFKGEATRLVIIDQAGKFAERLKENLTPDKIEEKARQALKDSQTKLDASNEEKMKNGAKQIGGSFVFVDYDSENKPPEQIKNELTAKILKGELDAYLIVPQDFESSSAKFEFYSRKAGDFVVNSSLQEAINDSVRLSRMANANINEAKLKEINQKPEFSITKISEKGEEKGDNNSFAVAFALGLMIYITLAIYGQTIMGAVVEEKETRIAEILFSSAKPFELMMGKLVGVGLAGLTQLAIWISSALLILSYFVISADANGFPIALPTITPVFILCFFIFFLLGFFIYATIFAFIGSMVTTVQEGGQFAFLPIIILFGGLYSIIPVVRDPNSALSFWISIAPFLSPMTMPARVLTEMPPLWHILLAIFLNAATIAGLVWLASRVYRVGMLMYGKRATIPEVWKWIRQA